MSEYFSYGDEATNYLCKHDTKLGAIIGKVGHINRPVDHDLFASVVHHIIGQQISTKAQNTVWQRAQKTLGIINAQTISVTGDDLLQSFGITYRKVDYIKDFAAQVIDGSIDLDAIWQMPDTDAINALCTLRGIGKWTAEMILLFCMERPDVLSFGDLAILRGMRMVYHHRTITRELFEKYRRRYSPFGSVASLYLWAVAGGAIEGMRDPGSKNTGTKSSAETKQSRETKRAEKQGK